MENNQLINRINNLIMTEDHFEENDISLDKFITFVKNFDAASYFPEYS